MNISLRLTLLLMASSATLTGPSIAWCHSSLTAELEAASSSGNGDDFLPVDQAFRLDALAADSSAVRLVWEIADGYYLYKSRIRIVGAAGAPALGQPAMPTGQFKTDEYFGKQEIYHHELAITVPVLGAPGPGELEVPLQVSYQGCAEKGLCYPPATRAVRVKLPPAGGGTAGSSASSSPQGTGSGTAASGFVSEQDWFASKARGSMLSMLFWFYAAGLGLAFTPCVLPMVPILSGIIAGQGSRVSAGRGFLLSLAYVLGMALTYTAAGAACAAAGQQVQALFQQAWILVLFAAVFVAMALAMFGLFTVQMPVALQTRIADLSNRQSAGTVGGVAMMGALSALIVTTCVGPALVGALLVISQSGQVLRGASALFAMSIGMGTPLLIVGASAGKLLPKAGPWMDSVRKFFGVMLLAVSVWMLARLVPDRMALALWAVPALAAAWVLWSAPRAGAWVGSSTRAGAAAAVLYSLTLLVGAALGGTDPLAPLALVGAHRHELAFKSIKSVADLEREVASARNAGRTVLLDFYADWCTSCKEMERYTFSSPTVQAALGRTVLLRADVTRNDGEDQQLLQHFGIFGPPTIALYGQDGRERAQFRVVGYMKADAFTQRLKAAFAAQPPSVASSS